MHYLLTNFGHITHDLPTMNLTVMERSHVDMLIPGTEALESESVWFSLDDNIDLLSFNPCDVFACEEL